LVTKNHVYFVVNDDFLPSALTTSHGGSQNRTLSNVYSYTKSTNKIHKVFTIEDKVWISSVDSDENYLVIANKYLVNTYNLEVIRLGNIINFEWIDKSKYQVSYKDTCPNNPDLIQTCTLSSKGSICDQNYYKIMSFYDYADDIKGTDQASDHDIPNNWELVPDQGGLVTMANYSPGYYKISGSINCPDYHSAIKGNTEKISISGLNGTLITFPFQNNFDLDSIMEPNTIRSQNVAVAVVNNQNHDMNWLLSVNGKQNTVIDQRDWNLAVKDFKTFLNTVRIHTSN
jgi:hypothetical protein